MESLVTHSRLPRFWLDRSVYVTGATGLVGSWLVETLVQLGANVTCLVRDRVPASRLWAGVAGKKVNIVYGSVTDYRLLERSINEYESKTVFHLAAQTIVGVANRSALATFETNIRGTWNLFEACRQLRMVEQVVFASSDKAYGAQEKLPYEESAPLIGSHPYDVSKACGDLLATAYFTTYGLPVCVTRCGNFYGPGDLNWNRIVPGTIRSVLRGERPVIRSDGTNVRDYFYVLDGVAAYLQTAEAMASQGIRGEAFNFSNEAQVSALEMVNRILTLMRSDLASDIRNEARGEIPHQYLSAAKARRVLGWKPHYSLDEGLKETIVWYRALLTEKATFPSSL